MSCVLPGWMLCLPKPLPGTTSREETASREGTAHPADPNHRHPGVNIIAAAKQSSQIFALSNSTPPQAWSPFGQAELEWDAAAKPSMAKPPSPRRDKVGLWCTQGWGGLTSLARMLLLLPGG